MCPRCKNQLYPAEFDNIEGERHAGVKYCKKCKYPQLSEAARKRIGAKLEEVRHVVLAPKGLKKIDFKYLGETLDPQKRPLEELEVLHKQWLLEWDENYEKAGNFYDWVGTIKGTSTVLQLTAEQRVDYVVTIRDNKLTGQYVSTRNSDYAFVLDGLGTFYAAPKQTSGAIRLHHSSFLSGAPAQCAGVFFCMGKADEYTKPITYVKDYSGHYQPGVPELLRLKRRLTDLGEGKVQLWYYGSPPQALPRWKGDIATFDPGSIK